MAELSLLRAKAKFFDATADERAIQNEHKRLLSEHIDACISHGEREVFYVVPETITGSLPNYNVAEQAILLVRQCRRGGLTAKLVSSSPYMIHVSGWCVNEEMLMTTTYAPPKAKTKVKIKTKVVAAPIDDLSRMAQRGEISSRLKHVAKKYRADSGKRR